MRNVRNLLNLSIFYLLVIITFFLPQDIAKVIFLIDIIFFTLFLDNLNRKANTEIKTGSTEALRIFVLNLIVFSIIQLVFLYGLIGWLIL